MAITLVQISDLLDNDTLRKQVRGAILFACDVIRREPDETPNHAERLKLRLRMLQYPDDHARKVFPWVMTVPAITVAAVNGTAADADVKAAVLDAIDTYLL